MKALYIVTTAVSSPNQVLNSENIREKNQKLLTYKFDEETRQAISRVRMRTMSPIYQNTLEFHSLHICNEEQGKFIARKFVEADEEMKKIHPSLKAEVEFFPLNMDEMRRAGLYMGIVNAIKYRVYKDTFDRMEDFLSNRKDKLPERSKQAMMRMVDNLRAVNIVDDEEIDKHLNEIEQQINDETIIDLRDDMFTQWKSVEAEIEASTKGRWNALEI